MKKIIDLIKNKELPSSLPHTCKCGSELVTNDRLTEVWCSNPDCYEHTAGKLIKMFKTLNIKSNIGYTRAEDLCFGLKLINPMQIFDPRILDVVTETGENVYIELASKLRKFKTKPIKSTSFMDALEFDCLGTTRANLIFNDIENPVDIYEKLGKLERYDKLVYIGDKIKVSPTSDTVINILNELEDKMGIIETISQYFKFKEVNDETIYVIITGPVTRLTDDNGKNFSPREKLCDYLTDKTGKNIIPLNSFNRHISYLIMDTNMTGNSKYQNALKKKIPVIKSDELLKTLKDGGYIGK